VSAADALRLQATRTILAVLTGLGEGSVTATGVVAEGLLAGISAWLVDRIGPEAAYETIQRHADAIATGVADDQVSRGDVRT
jgi:hypothetical protein